LSDDLHPFVDKPGTQAIVAVGGMGDSLNPIPVAARARAPDKLLFCLFLPFHRMLGSITFHAYRFIRGPGPGIIVFQTDKEK